ncbi:MAG: Oxidoreductase NAD-binding domain/FAD binding domain/putative Fe-S cluster, partial [Rhodospirillales bacterium]|nr:Oxidoreductase NAD-binding domain/FAD binding domain/putative Fe-S cluster [Rhodospirillales bacterium]
AEARPLPQRLMAAMAQQDCGQCSYLCATYAEAIASGAEKSLTRCVPGGKETARQLKELIELGEMAAAAPAQAKPATEAAPTAAASVGKTAMARLEGAAPLNRAGSQKDTRHVVFDLAGTELDYRVGDALGVQAVNCPETVTAIIECLGLAPDHEVECPDGARRGLFDALSNACEIGRVSDDAVEVLASRAPDLGESQRLQALAEGYPGAGPEGADLLELLLTFRSARPPVQELVSALSTLEPRLYSISSSPKAAAGGVHLTVGAVRYEMRGRQRKGVASTYLTERAAPGAAVPVFVQPAHAFGLPASGDVPIIMIGPGTGVAPFRAFLQERRATGAAGKNWLFFGDQRRDCDFLYEAELLGFHKDGLLSELELAFSRDQAERIYVQQRMRERARELWAWLQDGACLYVCGAAAMAKDVDAALVAIIARQGGMGTGAARAYLATLNREKRYLREVY